MNKEAPPNVWEGSHGTVTAQEKIALALVKMARKILFKAVIIGIKTITRGERDGTQLQTQQEQVGV